MPKVLNKKTDDIKGAVCIDRTSPYGNPYIIGIHGDREEVVRKHKVLLEKRKDLRDKIRKNLRGRDVWCHCSPLSCHGYEVVRIANEED